MRQMARWGVLPLLAAPVGTWALGLGDIELQSALNQPLRAQIRLSATQEEIQDLDISVADQATFQRYGLDRPAFLSTLQFDVGKNDAGNDVIFVRSPQAIAEPFVTMLIEASWPNGRSLREYTVLLDPPVFAPDNAAPVRQAQTPPPAPARSAQPGGAIARAPAPRAPAPAAAPSPARTVAPTRAAEVPALGGTYGPVQRAETLWGIASQIKPAGVSMNQMLVAMYEANPRAFQGNMNLLRRGATLRIPDRASLGTMTASAATAEVRRQNQAWQAGPSGGAAGQEQGQAQARLRLVPPSEESGAGGSASSSASSGAPASTAAAGGSAAGDAEVAELRGRVDDLQSQLDESQRLLEVRDDQLRELQQRLAEATGGAGSAPADQPAAAEAAAGVELEGEQVFADEADSGAEAEAPAAPEDTAPSAADTTEQPAAPAATQPPPADVVSTTSAPPSPSLLSRVLSVVAKPVVLIGLGAGVVLLAALWYLRRRREDVEDVTGRWEALEREVDEEGADHDTTARLRRRAESNEDFIVEETAASAEPAAEPTSKPFEVPPLEEPAPVAADTASTGTFEMPDGTSDETLSSQTVINLDQADPVAEADFHMAYGLYDQAAELVSQALERDPGNRGLQLKLLEVFFVWGNKEAFLDAAKALRAEMGDAPDSDWDKVVIMGKQICPDEALFAGATAAAGEVDLDLDAGAGESPLDFAFEDSADAGVDLDLGGTDDADLQLETTADREAQVAADTQAATGTHGAQALAGASDDEPLDIGEATSAGLEEALFGLDDEDDTGRRTAPDIDSLAETQESPTVESPHAAFGQDEASAITMETPTVETPRADASEQTADESPTVESATVRQPGADTGAPTVETPMVETSFASEPTVEHAGPGNDGAGELTAELDLDDLGLDVKDLEGLPGDLGELPAAESAESDTREQPALEADTDDELLSATGVTQVLSGADGEFDYEDTSVLGSNDETMLAASPNDATMASTEVLEQADEAAENVEAKAAANGDASGLDLNLDDFSAALGGGDTVEQPRARSFTNDVFGAEGRTPVDLDVGMDVAGSDDPTGTEEVGPLDPQTMTEVGTKLDLARAYIDMGDPEGARSILEEVLDEGDAGQKREAQSLISVLTA